MKHLNSVIIEGILKKTADNFGRIECNGEYFIVHCKNNCLNFEGTKKARIVGHLTQSINSVFLDAAIEIEHIELKDIEINPTIEVE